MSDNNFESCDDVDKNKTWFLRRTFNNNEVSGTSSGNTTNCVSSSATAGDKNNKGKSDKTVTPSPPIDSTARSSRAERFHKRMKKRFLSSSDDDSDALPAKRPATKRSTRRNNTSTTAATNKRAFKSKVHKTECNNTDDSSDDNIQLVNVERKRSPVASDIMKGQSKNVSNSVHHQSDNLTIASLGFMDPSPPFSQQNRCSSCGNKGYMCHDKMYSTYCTKACMAFLQTNSGGWQLGFNVERMETTFFNAYNEKRRVDLEERFGFYNTDWFEIPDCMRKGFLQSAINLGYNPKLCSDLENHNSGGQKKYLEALKNFRG